MNNQRTDFMLVAAILIICLHVSRSHNGTELHNDLFQDYKPAVRPCDSYNQPIDVKIRLSLIKILHVDEITQTFEATVTLIINWNDELLVWDPKKYAGINHIIVPYNSVWTPDVIVINAAETPGDIGQKYALVKVRNDGAMKVWTQVNLKTQCNIGTKRYPFDVQECSIDFCTFMSDDRDINLHQDINITAMTYFQRTAEWNIIGNYVSVETDIASAEGLGNYTTLKYNFKLKRQCLSCIINVILPVVLLGCLSLLTFFVPSDSGEKMSFPVSIFLTLAVFMTVITLSLPESVDGLSYLGMYVTFELGTGVIILACSVIALRLHQREEVEKKHYYHILLVRIFTPKYLHLRKLNSIPGASIKKNSRIYKVQQTGDIADDVKLKNHSDTTEVEGLDVEGENAVMWTHVSKAFDFFIFILMIILQILALFSFLCLIIS